MSTGIAVVGAGLIGREHLRRVVASPTCDLAAIVDPAPAAAELARQHGVPVFGDLDELLTNARPDGVVIATPNQMHYEQALRCIDAGVPMLLEKPVTDSLATGEALAACCHERDATVLVGHHRTHSPVMRTTREVIESGALGQVVAVAATAFWYKPDDYFEAGPWRREAGGGPILINLIHEVHNLRIMCGEVSEVEALSSNRVRGLAVEDTAGVVLRFRGGALATILLSDVAASGRSWEHTVQENVSFATYPDEDCYHIAGTMGSLSVPTMRLKLFADPDQRSWYTPMTQEQLERRHEDPLTLQMEHFRALVRGEVDSLCTIDDGLENVRVLEAVSRSALTGELVRLDQRTSAATVDAVRE